MIDVMSVKKGRLICLASDEWIYFCATELKDNFNFMKNRALKWSVFPLNY